MPRTTPAPTEGEQDVNISTTDAEIFEHENAQSTAPAETRNELLMVSSSDRRRRRRPSESEAVSREPFWLRRQGQPLNNRSTGDGDETSPGFHRRGRDNTPGALERGGDARAGGTRGGGEGGEGNKGRARRRRDEGVSASGSSSPGTERSAERRRTGGNSGGGGGQQWGWFGWRTSVGVFFAKEGIGDNSPREAGEGSRRMSASSDGVIIHGGVSGRGFSRDVPGVAMGEAGCGGGGGDDVGEVAMLPRLPRDGSMDARRAMHLR